MTNDYQKLIYQFDFYDDIVKQKLLYLLENGISPEVFAQSMLFIAETFYTDYVKMLQLEEEVEELQSENKNMITALEDIQADARRAIP